MKVKKGIYKHFKGHTYKVIGIGRHSESLEEFVVYINTEDENDIWLRPEKMFLENVTKDGETFPRFQFIKED
ncbi:MAG: DUF1653 domain-containing protein [Bacteroidales bacterium]|nr:DUF1653 domain-containing protein [Bacteroidales bacterium]